MTIARSEEAYEDIKAAIDECWRQIDIPADDDIVIDRGRVHEANRLVVTAGQVEKLANKMGAIGKGLNKRRVETLAARRKNPLRPCAVDGDVKFFRLGDVLDAHHRSDESGKKAG
ncbi:hypothetical protein [Mycobacteroides abscessus]|uniref:hypothetical protein n=1 Tax=Mycobacteroides abscessus TaxID=36809 RepID=UPI000C25EE41|nr:hypothetical protein [Mycobacteroides abscessus]